MEKTLGRVALECLLPAERELAEARRLLGCAAGMLRHLQWLLLIEHKIEPSHITHDAEEVERQVRAFLSQQVGQPKEER